MVSSVKSWNKVAQWYSKLTKDIIQPNKKLKDFIKKITLSKKTKLEKIKAIYITYPDRLTRFGYDYFVEFFKALGVEVRVVNNKEYKELQEESAEDLIAILTFFANKLYGMRASKIKTFLKELRNEN